MGSEDVARAAEEDEDQQQEMDFVTLGMFIIDEIEFLPPKPPVRDILGGAGSWSALGARLFSPPPLSRSVGWIIDQGSDFPAALTDLVDSWATGVVFRSTPDRLTTRGWNGYVDDSGLRAFRYTSPKKRLDADDLSGPLLRARAFHLICSPSRCRDLIGGILARRRAEATESDEDAPRPPRPLFIWEPVPDLCVPDELLNCTNALPLVDVCSPNHAELAGFMGSDGLDPETGEVSIAAVEQNCEQLLASMPLQSYTLVIRAAEKGCYITKNGGRKRAPAPTTTTKPGAPEKRKKKDYVRGGLRPDTDMEALFAGLLQDDDGAVVRDEIEIDAGLERWIPAYHHRDADGGDSKVVDPTGGGNAFLGALAVALGRGETVEEACLRASVAASFAIEQVGVPELGADEEGRETWNCVCVEDRLGEFRERVGMTETQNGVPE